MEPDPIIEIQQQKDFEDIGKSAFLMKKGAIDAGATEFEAQMILVAWFAGISIGSSLKEDDEETPSS